MAQGILGPLIVARFVIAAKIACKHLADLQPICDGAWGQMDDWLMKRCDVNMI